MGKTYTLAAFANEWAQHETLDKLDATKRTKAEMSKVTFPWKQLLLSSMNCLRNKRII